MEYLQIMFLAVFVQNFVLAQFLGLCAFIGVSKKRSSAVGMGLAVIFVMTLSSLATMLLYLFVLDPPANLDVLHLKQYNLAVYLDIVSFILVIAALVQFVEMAMRKLTPALYKALGIYLPLITTNCAVLGVTQINVSRFVTPDAGFLDILAKTVLNGFFGGVGFMVAMLLMSAIRERLESAPVPPSLAGVPIAFITAACMALAFLGFAGFV